MGRGGRRKFLIATGALFTAPFVAEAQPAKKVYRVGYIISTTPVARVRSDPAHPLASFVREMRERGYVEGKNLTLELRSLEGKLDRTAAIAAEMVRLKVDVILIVQNEVVREAKRVTTTVPIVMLSADSPVEQGLVASLARPGGNVTGLSYTPGPETHGKRLELLKAAFPPVSRVAFIGSRGEWESDQGEGIRDAARQLGLSVVLAEHAVNDYTGAFAAVARERSDAIYVSSGSHNFVYRRLIAEFASKSRLPAIYTYREAAEAGGLIAFGVDIRDLFRRAAIYVDKILKGARPGDLPVEQPTKFELVVNLKTASALGFTIPQSVLLRADQIID